MADYAASDTSAQAVGFAAAVASAPAAAMLVGSVLLMRVQVSAKVQAVFQNLSAGIILAAVATELFPLLSKAPGVAGGIGTALGYLLGLALAFGVENAAAFFEGKIAPTSDEEGRELLEGSVHAAASELAGEHKDHIKMHLDELAAAVCLVDERAARLAEPNIRADEEEQLAEEIDEELHKLMYKLDHTRRLLEGAETGRPQGLPEAEKAAMRTRVAGLKDALAHLHEHMQAPSLDRPTVLEVHAHMEDLDEMLKTFHNKSSETFSRWRRSSVVLNEPASGRPAPGLPWSLVVPVTIDSLVDGFLIGLSCALSTHAGLVLAFATCIEMAFLGAAFAATVSRCTGARLAARLAVIVLPPLTLLGAAAVGAALGDISSTRPAVFVAFVAFGVVELLFLVTHELLIEAHEALNGSSVWWINVWLFVGIGLVLVMNRVLPGG